VYLTQNREIDITRVLYEKGSIYGVEIKFFDTLRTGKGESDLLCKN